MDTLTAHILIGPGTEDGPGVPTHALYLTEHPTSLWTLASTGIVGQGPQTMEKIVWVPTQSDMLEDGLLMLGLQVAAFPDLRLMANHLFKSEWRGGVELGRDIAPANLHELHAWNRKKQWEHHLVITVMHNSTIMNQLYVLRPYRFSMDVCPWQESRCNGPVGPRRWVCGESLADLLDPKDDTQSPETPY